MGDSCALLCLDLELAERLRRERVEPAPASVAAGRAKALGDPTRLTIALALEAGGELCVCDLAWIVERAQSLVSHHVRTLRSAGLVTSRREGKLVIYRLTEEGATLTRAVAPQEALAHG